MTDRMIAKGLLEEIVKNLGTRNALELLFDTHAARQEPTTDLDRTVKYMRGFVRGWDNAGVVVTSH